MIFNFKNDFSSHLIPEKLNNPFTLEVPEIASLACREFQDFISSESTKWHEDFQAEKGKMFGVLVIQVPSGAYAYLGAVSGKLPYNAICEKLVPSVFEESTGDYFLKRGMTELTEIGNKIKASDDQKEVDQLKESRKQKSIALQNRLFENYHLVNLSKEEKNILKIFEQHSGRIPPSAAGECAAPKLLQYAIKNELKPIALAEFWWGKSIGEKTHLQFYPACKDKCRPILEFMLEDNKL